MKTKIPVYGLKIKGTKKIVREAQNGEVYATWVFQTDDPTLIKYHIEKDKKCGVTVYNSPELGKPYVKYRCEWEKGTVGYKKDKKKHYYHWNHGSDSYHEGLRRYQAVLHDELTYEEAFGENALPEGTKWFLNNKNT